MEGDIEGPDGDPVQDFWIFPPRGIVSCNCRERQEEEYMEGIRRRVLRGAYVEEPWRSCVDSEEGMDVAAVGTQGRRRWEPWLTSRAASMVSKAADAAVWEDLKDIRPPMYDGNPPNLDRFLEKLENWWMTVTEEMDPAAAEQCVFKRF